MAKQSDHSNELALATQIMQAGFVVDMTDLKAIRFHLDILESMVQQIDSSESPGAVATSLVDVHSK